MFRDLLHVPLESGIMGQDARESFFVEKIHVAIIDRAHTRRAWLAEQQGNLPKEIPVSGRVVERFAIGGDNVNRLLR